MIKRLKIEWLNALNENGAFYKSGPWFMWNTYYPLVDCWSMITTQKYTA